MARIYNGRQIEAIASDIEGVLTPAKRTTINLDGLRHIQRYCESAPKYNLPPIFLVTGRPAPYVEGVIQNIGALGPYFNISSVLEHGAVFWDHNAREVCGYNPEINYKTLKNIRSFVEGVIRKNPGIIRMEPGKEVCISLDPIEMGVEDLFHIVVDEAERKKIDEIVDVTRSASAVDITPKGINKRSGLLYVLDKSGISPEHVLGVGDTEADVPWLQSIGVPAGPENATEDIKRIKGIWIADWPDSLGFAHILQHFILKYIKHPVITPKELRD